MPRSTTGKYQHVTSHFQPASAGTNSSHYSAWFTRGLSPTIPNRDTFLTMKFIIISPHWPSWTSNEPTENHYSLIINSYFNQWKSQNHSQPTKAYDSPGGLWRRLRPLPRGAPGGARGAVPATGRCGSRKGNEPGVNQDRSRIGPGLKQDWTILNWCKWFWTIQ